MFLRIIHSNWEINLQGTRIILERINKEIKELMCLLLCVFCYFVCNSKEDKYTGTSYRFGV